MNCRRPECGRAFDPKEGRLGYPNYCSGTCESRDSPAARAYAATKAAQAERRADASRANLEKARAALLQKRNGGR